MPWPINKVGLPKRTEGQSIFVHQSSSSSLSPSFCIPVESSDSDSQVAVMAMILSVVIVVLCWFLRLAYATVSSYWLTPRRIKNIMQKQGVRGPTTKFLVGNILDMAALVRKSTADDMETIDHDIVGRLLPHFLLWSQQYGIYIKKIRKLEQYYITHMKPNIKLIYFSFLKMILNHYFKKKCSFFVCKVL